MQRLVPGGSDSAVTVEGVPDSASPWRCHSCSVSTAVDTPVVAQRQVRGGAHCEKTVDFSTAAAFFLWVLTSCSDVRSSAQ